MSNIDDGGSAIDLRDYFAAKAMHAALVTAKGYDSFEQVAKNSADLAYMVADAMLAARKSREPEQQQSAGWIEWNGGECPVDPHCTVSVKFRSGAFCREGFAVSLEWSHLGDGGDIIAYRIVSNGDQK